MAETTGTPEPLDEMRQLSRARVREVSDALAENDPPTVRRLVSSLHTEDLAELLNHLSAPNVERLVGILGAQFDAETLPFLDPDTAENVLAHLGAKRTAAAIAEMELDDALHIIEDLDTSEQQAILASIDPATRKELEAGLSYPEDSAGRLMRRSMVFVPEFWTVGDTIDYLRRHSQLPEEFYVIYVVNPRFRPVGLLSLARVMQSPRGAKLRDMMATDLHSFTTHVDQEEVAHAFRKYGMVEAPVVGEDGRLLGTITVDDVVEVMREEADEDLLRLGGVSAQEMGGALWDSVKTRFFWLFVNLITAIMASAVIGMFAGTIQQVVTLAVLMPIIASMGGNAGIQSSTVTVRSIATRRLHHSKLRVMGREVVIGGLTGLGIAIVMGAGILVWYHDATIALIFAVALVLNMMVAGFAGAGLPMLMERFRIDPAITSGVFLTMFTDIVGFFAFLGLASLVILKAH